MNMRANKVQHLNSQQFEGDSDENATVWLLGMLFWFCNKLPVKKESSRRRLKSGVLQQRKGNRAVAKIESYWPCW